MISDPPVPKTRSTRLVRDLLLFLLVALLLGVALLFALREMRRTPKPSTVRPTVTEDIKENQYLRIGWQEEASRTLSDFADNPSPDRTGTFRAIVVEDVAERGRDVAGSRTHRLADPANVAGSARVAVPVDSDIGRTLATLNWRGTNQEGRPEARTATVELQWTDAEEPVLNLHRFLCWEFLGLGGTETPADPAPR